MWKKVLFCSVLAVIPLQAQISVSGTVLNQEDQPISSAVVIIEPANRALAKKAATDSKGAFYFSFDLPAGEYYLTVRAESFQETKREPIYLVAEKPNELRIKLIPIEKLEIEVRPESNRNKVDVKQMVVVETLDRSQMESLAAPRFDRLEGIIASLPQVTKDAKGNLHPAGTATDQINWLYDGLFKFSDPASGQKEIQLSNEAPESVNILVSRYSVDSGRGVLPIIIYGGTGTDQHIAKVTDFFPVPELTKGLTISDFKPRFILSGPIQKTRFWFFNALNPNYDQNIIHELPKGKDRVSSWDINNLTRVQANVTPQNVLTGSFLYNYLNAPNTGLGLLDPLETTLDKRARRKFLVLQNQFFTKRGNTITLGYGWYDSFSREIPQGSEIYQIRPTGRSGNAIADTKRHTNRHQLSTNASWRPIVFGSQSHELKTGIELIRSGLCRNTARSGYQHYHLDGTPSVLVTFDGNGQFCRSLFEQAFYFQDHWALKTWLHFEGGVRFDKDNIVGSGVLTPRIGLTAMPPRFGGIKFSAGFGLMPSLTNLGIFTQKFDQYSIETMFDGAGQVVGQPQIRLFTSHENRLKTPATSNLSFGIEKEMPGELNIRAGFLRKRSRDGFTFTPYPGFRTDLIPPHLVSLPYPVSTIWNLQNTRIEIYDSFNIGIEKRFRQAFIDQPLIRKLQQEDLSCNYTYSRSFSNSNLNPFVEEPITFSDTAGRTPWDIPSQFKCRGITQLGRQKTGNHATHRLIYFAEWRDGTPFSVHDEEGRQVGQYNSWRLPRYFTLNIHFEKKFRLRTGSKKIWAIRLGMDNVFNRPNYSSANENISALNFPGYYGREPRKLTVRLNHIRN